MKLDSSSPKLGVIGLGQMGAPMALNLLHRFPVLVHDIDQEAVNACVRQGARAASGTSEIFAHCDVVLLSLPTEAVVEHVLLGEEGPKRRAEEQSAGIIIDTSTTTMTLAQRLVDQLDERGWSYLDAPVTGGRMGAERGTLSIMVGASADAFARVRPVLEVLGDRLVHVGPSGHGQASKMVNQMLMGALYVSVAEAFAFAAQLGVDVARVYDAVENGGAQSRVLSRMRKPLLAGTTSHTHNLLQHGKDVAYVWEEARRRGIELPVTESVNDVFRRACEAGLGHVAATEIWALWEKDLGIRITETIRATEPPIGPAE